MLCGEVFENSVSECSLLAVGGCLRGCTVRLENTLANAFWLF